MYFSEFNTVLWIGCDFRAAPVTYFTQLRLLKYEVSMLARVSGIAAVVSTKLCSLYNHCDSITPTYMNSTLFTNANFASV